MISSTNTNALRMCAQVDLILRHGLNKANTKHGYWKYAQLFTRKDVVGQISKLSNVRTDLGRGRAWLRMALNE
jgi:pleckstrin family protein M 2